MKVIVTDRSGKFIEECEFHEEDGIDLIFETKQVLIEDGVATIDQLDNFKYTICTDTVIP